MIEALKNKIENVAAWLFWLLFGLYIGLHVTRLTMLSENLTVAQIPNTDQFVLMDNLRVMFEEFMAFRLKGFLYNCYFFGYGAVFWILSFVAGFPAMLMDSQQGIVLSQRFFSFGSSVASLLALIFVLKRYLKIGYLSILLAFPFIFHPIFIIWHTGMHPEALYSLFIVLSFTFILKDNGLLAWPYKWSIAFFALAVSTKMSAIFGVVFYCIYTFLFARRVFLSRILVSSIGIFLGVTFLVNIGLLFSLVRTRFLKWLSYLSDMNYTGSKASQLFSKIFAFQNYYFKFLLLGVIAIFVLFYLFNKQNKEQKTLAIFMATCICIAYIFFTIFCTPLDSHYAYPIYYFIFFLVAILFDFLLQRINCDSTVFSYSVLIFVFLSGFYLLTRGIAFLVYPWHQFEELSLSGTGIYTKNKTFVDSCRHVHFINALTDFLKKHNLCEKKVCVSPMGGVIKKSFSNKTNFFPVASPCNKAIEQADILCFRIKEKASIFGEIIDKELFFNMHDIQQAPWRKDFEEVCEASDYKIFVKKNLIKEQLYSLNKPLLNGVV